MEAKDKSVDWLQVNSFRPAVVHAGVSSYVLPVDTILNMIQSKKTKVMSSTTEKKLRVVGQRSKLFLLRRM